MPILNVTTDEGELIVNALEILSPDTVEGQQAALKLANEMRTALMSDHTGPEHDIHKTFGALGFTEEQMGGGATAFTQGLSDHGTPIGYILVTDTVSDIAPTDATLRYSVGFYHPDGDETDHFRSDLTLEQAIEFVEWLGENAQGPGEDQPLDPVALAVEKLKSATREKIEAERAQDAASKAFHEARTRVNTAAARHSQAFSEFSEEMVAASMAV